ncbi:efflux RND transporter permease subunit [Nevskia soli]|uniref:efflux RND transporter permease subunit n=1 Tax=Nevskia soli TaxID=418856 RepID=UPI000569498F|nr:MMPL family transporter [Nevskia soli]
MYALRWRIAHWMLAHRRLAWALFAVVTLFFSAGLPRVQLRTIFSDLLPKDDPFVQVYKDHPGFGNPLTMAVMIRHRNGTIYDAATLAKVWKFTRDIDLAPGVDHDQILSITTEKARYSEATPFGVDMRPLMGDAPPRTLEEVQRFRDRVDKAPNVRIFLISRDEHATLITATFIEQRVDYGVAFRYVQGLVEAARDVDHEVELAGQPVLIGWVYQYERQMIAIFAITIGALVMALALYMRNLVGVLTPIVTSATAAVWAFGLVGWLRISIEPLLMVVPLLLTARSFSHSVQFTERFYEVYAQLRDRHRAAETTMALMMAPSVLGIVTDILGIFIVIAAPIPAMVRHAIFCGMWAVWLIPTGVGLISLLLASLPPPRDIERLVARRSGVHEHLHGVLGAVASLSCGRCARWTAMVVFASAALAIGIAQQIRFGNPVEGSGLLWDDSEFNIAVRAINASFPGVNTLEIVLEAKNQKDPNWVANQADTILTMQRLQRLLEDGALPPRATLSFADYVAEGNRLFSGGNPKWLPLDPNDTAVNAAAVAVMMGSSAKNFGNVVNFTMENTTVSLWYRDNKQETVDAALAAARTAVDEVGADHQAFRIRLATGTIALQEAVNRVIARFHVVVIALLNLFILASCSVAYRSLSAGALLLIPVNLANQVLYAAMHLMGVGLDVNSLIVAAIGVGVGIDYGIYLLSRICEEYLAANGDWERAIAGALRTTGKAILFTAMIMILGIAPWYFLSGLRFVADMGLLLIIIMLINMVLALVVLPLLVWLVKPAFVRRLHPQPVEFSFAAGNSGVTQPAGQQRSD